MRALSYNVHGFPWIPTDIPAIVAWLTQAADIVALQEVWSRREEWRAAFAARGWAFHTPPREHHIAGLLGFGSGLAIATPRSWQLHESRFYPFLAAAGLDALVVKGWMRAELTGPDGYRLRILNTHCQADADICPELWKPTTEAIRLAQIRQLMLTETRLAPAPTLLLGDFNTAELFGCPGWQRACAEPTFPATGETLDHCIAWGPWTLIRHEVLRQPWSDHFPVRWTLQLSPRPHHPPHRS